MANNIVRIKDFFKVISRRVALTKNRTENMIKGMVIIQKGIGFVGMALDKMWFDEKKFDPAEMLSGLSGIIVGCEIIANQFDASVIDIIKIEMVGMEKDVKKAKQNDGTMS